MKSNEDKVTEKELKDIEEIEHMTNMEMPDRINMLEEFHKVFGLAIHDHPDKISTSDFKLRLELIKEEFDELIEAHYNRMKDPRSTKTDWRVETLDALCDLEYVLLGAVIQLGFGSVFREAFLAVHESNMTKVLDTIEVANEEAQIYRDRGTSCRVEENNGKFIIKRLSDGKILKPSRYSSVNLSGFIKLPDN